MCSHLIERQDAMNREEFKTSDEQNPLNISLLDDDQIGESERISEEYTGRLGRFNGVMNPAAGIR